MPQGDGLHRRLTVLGAVLVLAGGLAACTRGGGAEPGPTAATTSSSTAAPSDEATSERPAVEKPVPPDTMARDDVAGAEAAAQYFLALYPYVFATGDLAEWQEISHPECGFCNGVAEEVEAMHAAGGFVEGGRITIETVTSTPPETNGVVFQVDARVLEDASERLAAIGDKPSTVGAARHELIFAIQADGNGWIVREVDVLSTEAASDAG